MNNIIRVRWPNGQITLMDAAEFAAIEKAGVDWQAAAANIVAANNAIIAGIEAKAAQNKAFADKLKGW